MENRLYETFYGGDGVNYGIFMLINHAWTPFLDLIMPAITFLGGALLFYPYFLFLAVISIRSRQQMPRRYLWAYGIGMVLALLVEWWLKNLFHVPRPALAIGIDHIRILGEVKKYNSLPSGHAVFSFMTAFVLSHGRSWRWKIPLFLFALLVAYSRIYVGAHYPLDVFAGALVGCGCGYLAWLASSRF